MKLRISISILQKKYDHSAIFVQHTLPGFENAQWLLETIREKSGDEYYLMMHGDPTWAIPDGDNMMDFAVQMLEEPEKLNEMSAKRVEESLNFAEKLNSHGHLLDGFALCSDYCFNVNFCTIFSLNDYKNCNSSAHTDVRLPKYASIFYASRTLYG